MTNRGKAESSVCIRALEGSDLAPLVEVLA
ncbi:hypothetical protein MSR1_25310 [Magnetospirillum gryphiswaldense MSR-1]|nr:hypothetical protein MSR1_25310 [Magnetospirillum gryphiswaldense MSR-1]AVM78915.1 hypothetical protein MSR1L_25310 [Magnetospirillum gryphiswaldense]